MLICVICGCILSGQKKNEVFAPKEKNEEECGGVSFVLVQNLRPGTGANMGPTFANIGAKMCCDVHHCVFLLRAWLSHPRPHHRDGQGCTTGVLLGPPVRRHIEGDVLTERELARLVLRCQVQLWVEWACGGHGNNVCEVAESCTSSNTSPRSNRRAVTCGRPTRKIAPPDLTVRCPRPLIAVALLGLRCLGYTVVQCVRCSTAR